MTQINLERTEILDNKMHAAMEVLYPRKEKSPTRVTLRRDQQELAPIVFSMFENPR